jgi:hypothetical protein
LHQAIDANPRLEQTTMAYDETLADRVRAILDNRIDFSERKGVRRIASAEMTLPGVRA